MPLNFILLINMELDLFILILGVIDLIDLDTSWSIRLTHASEQSITVLSDSKLGYSHSSIHCILGVNRVPNFFVATNHIDLVHLVGDVHRTSHNDLLLVEILVLDSSPHFFERLQVIEINITVHAARGKSHVILEPVDRPDSVDVTLALVVRGVLISVEVVNINRILVHCTGEKMASVGESNLSTAFNLDVLEGEQTFREDVHKQDFISDCNHDVES